MTNITSVIKAAEAAIEIGDYGTCIKIVNPSLISYKAETALGGKLRLLLVTAYMGKGDEQKAIDTCKILANNKKESIRLQVKQLLSILDAPKLPRPSNWSVEIPKIEMEPSQKLSFRKTKKKQKTNNYPPTGPTKNLGFGFSIISLLIILLLTFLLSGCADISTNVRVTGPDRLKLSLDIESNSGKLIPWQVEFANNLTKENSLLKIQKNELNQHYESPDILFNEANILLKQIAKVAANTSGSNINQPKLITKNKNLLIGTKQNLIFYFDLRGFPKIPGLNINLILQDMGKRNNFKTRPLEPIFKKGSTSLRLEIGKINQLEVSNWKWNQLSIGIILITFLISLSVSLQRFRLKMGLGFPELPP